MTIARASGHFGLAIWRVVLIIVDLSLVFHAEDPFERPQIPFIGLDRCDRGLLGALLEKVEEAIRGVLRPRDGGHFVQPNVIKPGVPRKA